MNNTTLQIVIALLCAIGFYTLAYFFIKLCFEIKEVLEAFKNKYNNNNE